MQKFLRVFWFLLNHPQVGQYKKLIYVGLPIAYWFLPDLIPFIIDDLIILALGFRGFVKSASHDVKNKNGDIIDVEARVIKDE
ncbi:MAG: hypothetical protein APF76_10395 [Desulfitibacter sp. BRH_c19]|nr:MAG: hypothetical protein APF76_10395 [Desulfitibacter sp. BRH_c19]